MDTPSLFVSSNSSTTLSVFLCPVEVYPGSDHKNTRGSSLSSSTTSTSEGEAAKPNLVRYSSSQIMTDSLPEKEVSLDGDIEEKMENNDMFVSAMDSPTDSGLETNKTSNSDTMEDLSLQVKRRFFSYNRYT